MSLVTPFNYTAWGFRDCQRDPTNPGFGSSIGPLLLRGLPYHYPENSVYTWYGPHREILNGVC
jgi:linoleate 10R-lipoxygenase